MDAKIQLLLFICVDFTNNPTNEVIKRNKLHKYTNGSVVANANALEKEFVSID